MSNRPGSLGARLLILGWLIVIVVGFFTSLVMSIMAFRNGTTTSGVTLAPLRLGALYCAIGHTLRAMICSQTGNDAIKATARILTSLMSKLGRY